MRWEYHVAAIGGEDDSVRIDLVDILNTLGAQGWELATALPLGDTLLLIMRREAAAVDPARH